MKNDVAIEVAEKWLVTYGGAVGIGRTICCDNVQNVVRTFLFISLFLPFSICALSLSLSIVLYVVRT